MWSSIILPSAYYLVNGIGYLLLFQDSIDSFRPIKFMYVCAMFSGLTSHVKKMNGRFAAYCFWLKENSPLEIDLCVDC